MCSSVLLWRVQKNLVTPTENRVLIKSKIGVGDSTSTWMEVPVTASGCAGIWVVELCKCLSGDISKHSKGEIFQSELGALH